MSDEFDPGAHDVIVIPFIFVPHGAPPPSDWLRDHPDYIRLPAVFVRQDGGDGAPDWSLRLQPEVRNLAAQAEPAGWLETLGNVFGIPPAQAQTRGGGRRGVPGMPQRSPAEELRLMRFEQALRRLRELEPDNRELSFVRDPDNVPGEAWVEELEREVIAAMARESVRSTSPPAAPERSGLSVWDLVMPGGTPIGRREKGAGEEVATIGRGEDDARVAKLMAMRPMAVAKPRYEGRWYSLPDGTGFGLRRSNRHGDTIDFENPALGKGFKVHVP